MTFSVDWKIDHVCSKIEFWCYWFNPEALEIITLFIDIIFRFEI